ncbi:alpha/beta hydrolase [Yoonia sp. F2084L]|uniref:alpha/beta fold hydrolase n=1 Tax=Yoonia sp. F2084L TaxID=2926419 RepID=UPI001FF424C0|nr:alpha/beta hydrolase [Yoonia sp. F2084L]MCK0096294.1 alpha/beta hydrolase [Yoonia sp. F2084L]
MPRETLVMIPPMLSDARIFAPQMQVLSRAHAVMVAPPTCGERIEEIASQILSWSPSKFALCGMGMGGMVAMELLRRAPERITRIALLSTSPQADTPEAAAAREPHIIAARAGRWDDVLQHEINSTWMAPSTDKVDLVRQLTEMGRDMGPDVYVKQARAMQRRKDQQATLRQVQQPVAVICGRHDGQYHLKRHEFLAELIPYAQLEIIEGAGYLPTLEAPDATTDALERWMAQPLMLRP